MTIKKVFMFVGLLGLSISMGITGVYAEQNEDKSLEAIIGLKQQVVTEINGMVFLEEEELESLIDAVNRENENPKIYFLLNKARQLNLKNENEVKFLPELRKRAEKRILNLDFLNLEEKRNAIFNIKKQKKIVKIKSILQEAIDLNIFRDIKEYYRTELGEMTYLTDEEINKFQLEVTKQETVETASEIYSKALELNGTRWKQQEKEQELKQHKLAVINQISSMSYLSDEQQASFVTEVNLKLSVTEIDEFFAFIQKECEKMRKQAELETCKKDIKLQIVSIEALSDDEKENFIKTVDQQENVEGTMSILNQALEAMQKSINEAKNQEVLKNQKRDVQAYIDNMDLLTEEQRAEFKKLVENQNTVEEINAVLEKAHIALDQVIQGNHGKKVLEKQKNEAKIFIATLTNLTSDEQKAYKEQIATQNTFEAFLAIVELAKAQNDAKLSQMEVVNHKKEAKNYVNKMIGLGMDQKAYFIAQIEKQTTIESIWSIVDKAHKNIR